MLRATSYHSLYLMKLFVFSCPEGDKLPKNWLQPQQWTRYNPGFIPEQWNYWRPGNSKGKCKGPDQSFGKEGVSVTGQEGLFDSPQLGCVSSTQLEMIIGTRMKWKTMVKALGQDDGPNGAKRRRSRKSSLRHSLQKLLSSSSL